ncbi:MULTISPECIES: Imm53 family immunity protein [Paenibacillus]
MHCFVEENTFKGYGGPNNLREILEIFKNWASIHA